MRSIVLVAFAWLIAGPSVHAADSAGQFALKGAARTNCERFVEVRVKGGEDYALFLGWLDGYITGLNQVRPETFDIAPWESAAFLASLIEHHCAKHPDDEFIGVVLSIFRELEDKRLRQRSPTTVAAADGREVRIYESILRRVQEELAARGSYRSEINGRFGPAMREAITAFQREYELPETGVPDETTLWRLLKPLAKGP